jgi:hypothetical protein
MTAEQINDLTDNLLSSGLKISTTEESGIVTVKVSTSFTVGTDVEYDEVVKAIKAHLLRTQAVLNNLASTL